MVQKFSKTNKIIFLMISAFLFVGAFFMQEKVYAYGDCSEYGFMATYDYLSGGCKCMSGYVFGKDFLGQTTCVSGSSVCYDEYGYGSEYDSLSASCKCSYGYVFGKDSIGQTSCISEDQACKNQYGYNAKSSYGGQCECSYGYVISGGQCTYGNTLCHSKHGLYSSYDDLSKSCECDSGYTFNDSNQCVEKQNNVYFTLKELDTDERRAIIKSDYDYRYYLISYNSGCYSSSFRRHLNHQIVVNLGTDFDLDTWDKIVLQDDNEVCDITQVERVDSNTTLEPEEERTFYFIPKSPIIVPPRPTESLTTPVPKIKKEFQFDETKKKNFETKLFGEVNASAALRKCPSTTECDVVRYLNPKTKVDILAGYNDEEWYQINTTDIKPVLSGWMHSSIISKVVLQEANPQMTEQKENDSNVSEKSTASEKTQKDALWYKKVFGFFSNLFK
ncbi:MAG: SH3 domain-containing protein [bacterium]|nr:SH3 domain-containing protein [bacterium]